MPCRPARLSLTRLDDRLTPSSGLDPTFGAGGVAVVGGLGRPAGSTPAEAALSDGSVLVAAPRAGGGVSVNRLTPAGVPDPTFGTAGAATVSAGQRQTVMGVAGAAGGPVYLLAAGGFADVRLFKLAADGAPDPGFPAGGVPVASGVVQGFYRVPALAVRTDGSVAVSLGRYENGQPLASVFVFTPAGAPDPTFGTNGSVAAPVVGLNEFNPTVLAADGNRLLLVGKENGRAEVVRLTPAGDLDPSFGAGGRVVLGDPGVIVMNAAAAPTPDGGLAVALVAQAGPGPYGSILSRVVVQKLTAAGAADPAFGTNGLVNLPALPDDPASPFAGVVTAYETYLSARPDGGLLVATTTFGSTLTLDLLTPAGAADARFAGDGRRTLNTTGVVVGDDLATHFVPLSGGRVAALSYSTLPSSPTQDAARLEVAALAAYDDPADGTADPTTVTFPPPVPGDLDGDGTADKIVTTGPRVSVVSGADGHTLIPAFAPFEASYTGTLNAVLADVAGDGRAELIVSPAQGGGPVVAVYNPDGTQLVRFFGIDDPAFRGGDRVTAGDVNGDGAADLVVTAGPGGGPRVAVYDGRGLAADRRKLVGDFFAFEPGLRGGVNVAVGDVTGDGAADLAFGAGAGGGPRVTVLSGADLTAGGKQTVVYNGFVGDPAGRDGARVGVQGRQIEAAAGPAAPLRPLGESLPPGSFPSLPVLTPAAADPLTPPGASAG